MNSNKPVHPVDVSKPACPGDICKPFFADYWRNVIWLLILFFVVSVNTSVFNRIILYLISIITIYMTYLILTKFFKCTCVILKENVRDF